jgi:hypothetical protein
MPGKRASVKNEKQYEVVSPRGYKRPPRDEPISARLYSENSAPPAPPSSHEWTISGLPAAPSWLRTEHTTLLTDSKAQPSLPGCYRRDTSRLLPSAWRG